MKPLSARFAKGLAAARRHAGDLPRRVRLSREKGWRMPSNAAKVDRSTPYGNPFRVTGRGGAEAAVAAFRAWLDGSAYAGYLAERREFLLQALPSLAGRDLCCWCNAGEACHADVLLELANKPKAERGR